MRLRSDGESFRATNVKRRAACRLEVTGGGPAFDEAARGSAPDVEIVWPEATRTRAAAMPRPRFDLSRRAIGRSNYDDNRGGSGTVPVVDEGLPIAYEVL